MPNVEMTRQLRRLLAQEGVVVAAGAHDALSARIVQQVGFPVCLVTGAGISMCHGYPDVGLISLEEVVSVCRHITEVVTIPVVVDADNGYGNPLSVIRTVRMLEQAGVAGMHMEDQALPKRCGHLSGKVLIPKEEMCQKIRAALDARRDENFLVMARCDALTVNGLQDVFERGEAYIEAGADMLFCEMRESLDEVRAIASHFRGRIPLHFNHSPSGRVPRLPVPEIAALGFKTVGFHAQAVHVAAKAMRDALVELKTTGNSLTIWDRMDSFEDFWRMGGMDEIKHWEKKYA